MAAANVNSNSTTVFYEDFRHSAGLIKLGRIDSGLEVLNRPGPLRVTIELLEQRRGLDLVQSVYEAIARSRRDHSARTSEAFLLTTPTITILGP